jgi:hypothetical protein
VLALMMSLLACDQEIAAPTYYADAQPMVEQYCVRCHYPGGQGGFDFTDRATVEAMADAMLASIDAGEMPPPVSDPACRDYVGSEHLVLPAETRDRFAAWIGDGMPEGEASEAPAVEGPTTTISGADLEVRLPAPYTPPFADPDNPGNEYRCFALEHGREEAFFVEAMAPLIDEQDLVHHIVVFPLDEDSVPEDYDPEEGYDCINRTGQVEELVAAWAPGTMPLELDEGLGIRINPDERIVLQMHYFQSGTEQKSDQSGYAFRTVDEVDTEVLIYPFGDWDFEIPAGEESYSYGISWDIPETINYSGVEIDMPDITVYGVFPHMHVLGSAYDLNIVKPDGSEECGLYAEKYSFDNQLTYQYREPLVIEGGDTLNWTCTWNNSTSNPDLIHNPPEDTRYGERTDEEMCWAFTLLSYEF